jgi:hypothetical protein
VEGLRRRHDEAGVLSMAVSDFFLFLSAIALPCVFLSGEFGHVTVFHRHLIPFRDRSAVTNLIEYLLYKHENHH